MQNFDEDERVSEIWRLNLCLFWQHVGHRGLYEFIVKSFLNVACTFHTTSREVFVDTRTTEHLIDALVTLGKKGIAMGACRLWCNSAVPSSFKRCCSVQWKMKIDIDLFFPWAWCWNIFSQPVMAKHLSRLTAFLKHQWKEFLQLERLLTSYMWRKTECWAAPRVGQTSHYWWKQKSNCLLWSLNDEAGQKWTWERSLEKMRKGRFEKAFEENGGRRERWNDSWFEEEQ